MQPDNDRNYIDEIIVSYLTESISAEKLKELTDWVKADKSNKRYFEGFSEIWVTSKAFLNKDNRYKQGFNDFKHKIGIDGEEGSSKQTNTIYLSILKIAAIIVISFILGGIIIPKTFEKENREIKLTYSEITVPRGAMARFSLFDGSEVTLNAGSKIKYANTFGSKSREVILEGEAYFKVAKNKDLPFIVKTSHADIRALGTEFNVKAYPDDQTIETTLVEGSVKIEQKAGKTKHENFILQPNQKVIIYKEQVFAMADNAKVNEKEKLEEKKDKLEPIKAVVAKNVNIAPSVSWKEERWIFDQQDLQGLATEFERRFDVRIHFGSDRLKKFRFTGTLLAEPIEQVLKVMEVSIPVKYKIIGKDIYLTEGKDFEYLFKLYN